MDWLCVIAVFFQRLGADIHICFAIAKYNRIGAFGAFTLNKGTQNSPFFAAFPLAARSFKHHHRLFDGFRCSGLPGHFYPRWRRQESIGDTLDLRCHCGAEEKRLAGKRRQSENALDIWDETHIKHPVRFIYHHDLNARQQQFSTFKVVQ